MLEILDTHQHMIYPERYAYEWTSGIPRLAGRAFRHSDYRAAAEGCGIGSTLFMEATGEDPARHDETAFVDSLSREPGAAIAGIIAACNPAVDDFVSVLDALPASVVGLRRILHVVPDAVSRDDHFRENLRMLGPRGLTFDLCFLARQLRIAAELAIACPQVSFVLDHCGAPDIATGDALDAWRADLAALAALPNVACKISGVTAYCDPADAGREAVAPFVEHCLEQFGADRVVWGSDWPLVEINSSLRDWVAITRAIVAGAPERDQRKLFSGNAARIYGVQVGEADGS